MEQIWSNFITWFMALGEPYNVNPVIFGSIYLGAAPFFLVEPGLGHPECKTEKVVGGTGADAGVLYEFLLSVCDYSRGKCANVGLWNNRRPAGLLRLVGSSNRSKKDEK